MKLITLATALTVATTDTVSGVKVPCLNESSCRNAAGNKMVFYSDVSAGNTKGCISKKDNAYFIPGTVDQMMDEDLPSSQKRLWCEEREGRNNDGDGDNSNDWYWEQGELKLNIPEDAENSAVSSNMKSVISLGVGVVTAVIIAAW